MSEIDWSRIAKQQDKYVHETDKIDQQRKLKLKQLYKKQLLNMIHQHENKANYERQNDRKLMHLLNNKQKNRLQSQVIQKEKKQKMKEQMARQNMKSVQNKRQKIKEQNQQFSKFYLSKYKKLNLKDSQEKKFVYQVKQHYKQQLSKAYNNQINEHSNKKLIQKLEDQKFVKLRQQIQQKKQQNRKKYLDKLRYGYNQNPEIYQLCKTLNAERENQKITFINKLATQQQRQLSEQKARSQKNKQKQIIQVSNYNRIYYESKTRKQRLQAMQQTAQYHMKNRNLQQQLQNQRQLKIKAKVDTKNILKNQLERQITQSHQKYNHKNKLNQIETNLNKSGHVAYLPGIVKDNSMQKHQRILQNFLGVRSSKSIDYSY